MQNNIVIYDAEKHQWLSFTNPVKIIETDNIAEVLVKFQEVEESVKKDLLYAVGFISYEAASGFDSALITKNLSSLPLIWFGLFNDYERIDLPAVQSSDKYFSDWKASVSKDEYNDAISKIKEHIRNGDTYQVNYTFRQFADYKGDAWKFFLELSLTQQGDYSAFIDTDKFTVCSASPELFFTYDKGRLTASPMKGTASRGMTLSEDIKQSEWLYDSEKNRAENLMILDMIRNDFGRVAVPGSVKVDKIFNTEKYPTVWQMTSTATAETDATITDIMKALFPCASITGAPKAYTMKIISELETSPRGIYTGSIGFISPENRAQFNVAIRTVVIDKQTKKAEYGVGGGIVWDSGDKDEYEECNVKTKVLKERQTEFSLLESILWTPGDGYFLLDYHLKRLSESAEYFDFKCNLKEVNKFLNEKIENYSQEPKKIRLLVDRNGKLSCQAVSILGNKKSEPVIKAVLADKPISITDPFLYHKTTNRKIYDVFMKIFPEFDNVILWNSSREVTEFCTANIVVKLGGKLYTPPQKCGLLKGTFRQYLLDCKKIEERVITIDDLKTADEIFLINSIRKWQKVFLCQ